MPGWAHSYVVCSTQVVPYNLLHNLEYITLQLFTNTVFRKQMLFFPFSECTTSEVTPIQI